MSEIAKGATPTSLEERESGISKGSRAEIQAQGGLPDRLLHPHDGLGSGQAG